MKEFDVTKDYNREDFLEFLSDFLPEDYTQEEEQTYFNYINIEEGYKLGTCDSLDLDVFEFRTKSEGNRDPRVTLTREAASFMKNYGSNQNALVIFYSNESHNWRFSLITTDYELVKGKVKPLYSNPKRFSFRLGGECKAHTPQTMLFKKGQICEHTENGKVISAIEDLKNRFALEVVSKQFFDEYKVFYEDFVQYITGNRYVKVGGKYERKPVSKENTKIFNQFKKLANDDYELACKYVRDYIKKLMGRLVFLHFLQKKGWLGVDAKDSWGKGNKNFLLDLFNSSQYKNDFLEKVLEPLFFGMLNTDVAERKMLFNYKKWDTDLLKEFKQIPYLNGGLFEEEALDDIEIKFPQEMFSNPAKADKERTFNDRKDYTKEPYPFTESCGLLDFFARYNFTIDETDPADMEIGVEPEMLGKIFENLLEDNKDKGAFYTPKEIVQYMCRESLIAYLGDNEKVRSLVITHNADFNDSEKNELIKKLKAVKVCDPAVGSGAFPMGMLNELFACRVALGENEEAAEIKKQIVRDNIYGVDIEKGAVDIARLRFWLAIIVDKKEPVALPNLDYKIMQGNSLLESYEGVDLSHITVSDTMFDDESDIEVLLDMLKDYYDKHNEKNAIRDSIKGAVLDLVEKRGINNTTYEKLQEIDLHSNSDFFLWHTWFSDVFNRPNDCNGFDIVIGNPPYIDSETMTNVMPEMRKIYSSLFETAKGNWDMFVIFIEQGINLCNKEGIYSFIMPNKLIAAQYAETLRTKLQQTSLLEIRDYSRLPIFSNAAVYPCTIVGSKKEINQKQLNFIFMKSITDYSIKNQVTFDFFRKYDYWDVFFILEKEFSIVKKFLNNPILQDSYEVNGAATVSEAYDIKEVLKDNNNLSNAFKVINTGTIDPYISLWGIKPMQYIKSKYVFPTISKNDLKDINETRVEQAKSEKIIIAGMSSRIEAVYDEGGTLAGKSTTIIMGKDLKYLIGILNSKLVSFAINILYNSLKMAGGYLNISQREIGNIPIPKSRKNSKIEDLVDKILVEKKSDSLADTSSFESQIDEIVYNLYGLTEDEKNIIRGK